MTHIDERVVYPIEEMSRIAHNFLNLNTLGFKESYRSVKIGKLIYDSELCRISLVWGGWDYESGHSINIRYGRLHALNEKTTMIWNSEVCRCWHRVEHPLHFLDGRTPVDAGKLNYSHPITRPFFEEEIRKRFTHRQPEWLAKMHVTIWQHYGTRLLELFDLKKPELWQQYRQFLKEVYDIGGRDTDIEPYPDQVC